MSVQFNGDYYSFWVQWIKIGIVAFTFVSICGLGLLAAILFKIK